jgi:hypothetical protein
VVVFPTPLTDDRTIRVFMILIGNGLGGKEKPGFPGSPN